MKSGTPQAMFKCINIHLHLPVVPVESGFIDVGIKALGVLRSSEEVAVRSIDVEGISSVNANKNKETNKQCLLHTCINKEEMSLIN